MRIKSVDTGTLKNFTIANFDFKEWNNENCKSEYKKPLDPCAHSDNSFSIENTNTGFNYQNDVLRIKATGKTYPSYCILFNDDSSTHLARICVEEKHDFDMVDE